MLQNAQLRVASRRLVQASFRPWGAWENWAAGPAPRAVLRNHRARSTWGMATVQTLRPPQTCPSETPPSRISNKLSLVTLTHTDV